MQLLAAASPGPAANGNVISTHGQLWVCPQRHAETSLDTPTSLARAVRCRHVSDGVGWKTRDAPVHAGLQTHPPAGPPEQLPPRSTVLGPLPSAGSALVSVTAMAA